MGKKKTPMRRLLPLPKLRWFSTRSSRSVSGEPAKAVDGGPTDFSPRFTLPSPEVIKAAGQRFFVPLDTSGSLVEEAARLSAASRPSDVAVPGGGVAVVRLSEDPYRDFLRSMQEMVGEDRRLDWKFMEDLLSCYLALNEESVHEHLYG